MSDHDHAHDHDHKHDDAHHEHGTMAIAAQEGTYNGFLRACVIVGGISTVVLLYLAACVA